MLHFRGGGIGEGGTCGTCLPPENGDYRALGLLCPPPTLYSMQHSKCGYALFP